MTCAVLFQHTQDSVLMFQKRIYFPRTHIGNVATMTRLAFALAVDIDLIATAVVVPSLLSPQTSHQAVRKSSSSSCSSFPLHPFVAVSSACDPPAIAASCFGLLVRFHICCGWSSTQLPSTRQLTISHSLHIARPPPLVTGTRVSCACAAIGSRCLDAIIASAVLVHTDLSPKKSHPFAQVSAPPSADPPISSRSGCCCTCDRLRRLVSCPFVSHLLWSVVRPAPLALATIHLPFFDHRRNIENLPLVVAKARAHLLPSAIVSTPSPSSLAGPIAAGARPARVPSAGLASR